MLGDSKKYGFKGGRRRLDDGSEWQWKRDRTRQRGGCHERRGSDGGPNRGAKVPGGGATSRGNHPHTPTVEDLLTAAEEEATGGEEVTADSGVATAGHFAAMPILRSFVTILRNGESRIGASQSVS